MEVPRLGVRLELQPLVYTRATATRDPSRVCDLHHSSWQRRILNPLSEARDRTRALTDTTGFSTPWATPGTRSNLKPVTQGTRTPLSTRACGPLRVLPRIPNRHPPTRPTANRDPQGGRLRGPWRTPAGGAAGPGRTLTSARLRKAHPLCRSSRSLRTTRPPVSAPAPPLPGFQNLPRAASSAAARRGPVPRAPAAPAPSARRAPAQAHLLRRPGPTCLSGWSATCAAAGKGFGESRVFFVFD